jgi:hypothetical protein
MLHALPVDYMILNSFAHIRVCGFFKLLFHRLKTLLARTQVTVFIILIKFDDHTTVSERLAFPLFNFTKNGVRLL